MKRIRRRMLEGRMRWRIELDGGAVGCPELNVRSCIECKTTTPM